MTQAWPKLDLPVVPPFPPAEAKLVEALPRDGQGQWQLEPKWDGFRCLVFRDGDTVALQSKAGQPLGRYFPEVIETVKRLSARRFVLDTEIVVPAPDAESGVETFDFDALLLRIHPAESRIEKLARETPAFLIAFDLLVDAKGADLTGRPLVERRRALEAFAEHEKERGRALRLSPATTDKAVVRLWETSLRGHGIDGLMAKRLDEPYRSGERTAMQKVKWMRTADCVVGGFRYGSAERIVGSLLLGLYDEGGLLHHVGFCSNLQHLDRAALTKKLESLRAPPGFTGRAPGGPSRWSTARTAEWEPVAPKLVVEVRFDHFSGGRFRHGTKLLRFRPDKAPAQCSFEQVERPRRRPGL
jgi:ATP-dependent DNA ligase